MEVRLAEHFGMCFGVRDAVAMALDLSQKGPVTILGDLVHNSDVVNRMEAAGAVRARQGEEIRTRMVLLTAHGTAERVKQEIAGQGFEIHDAACPLVKRVHIAVAKLIGEGRTPSSSARLATSKSAESSAILLTTRSLPTRRTWRSWLDIRGWASLLRQPSPWSTFWRWSQPFEAAIPRRTCASSILSANRRKIARRRCADLRRNATSLSWSVEQRATIAAS